MSQAKELGESCVVEYAARLDCAKNGCNPPHEDDGYVLAPRDKDRLPSKVNGHAVTHVTRTVTYGRWEPM